MPSKDAPQRQRPAARSTRYLTKELVRHPLRLGRSKISVDHAWQQYRALPPTIFQGRRPLWDEAVLDAHDAAHAFDTSE